MDDAVRSSKMQAHYAEVQEAERLSTGIGELERIRTQDVLARYLPKAPARILDVGGAAGVHALWLARQGYEVHLSDPVPKHVEEAKEASLMLAFWKATSAKPGIFGFSIDLRALVNDTWKILSERSRLIELGLNKLPNK